MDKLKEKVTGNWKFIACIILIGIMVLPMLYTVFYSLPSTDDFVNAANVKGNVSFLDCIRYANKIYFTWSGWWAYTVILTFANPLRLFSLGSHGLGIEMMVLFLLFMASLFSAISVSARKILGVTKKERIAVYILVFLFVFLNTGIYSEVYYWFVGSEYMMAMTLALFTIALTIKYFYDTEKRGRALLLSVVGILACNFFQESILPGMTYIVLWIYFSVKEGKLLWKKSIPFWFMFLSGVIAVAAPGNYARYASYTTEINLIKAVADTAKISVRILKYMVQQPLVIALLVLGVYIGIKHTTKVVRGIYPILAVLLSLATLVLSVFPVALGYAGVSFFPMRLYFFLDFVLLVGMVASAVCVGMYVKGMPAYGAFQNAGHVEASMMAFVFLLLYSTLVYGQNISKLPWVQTVAAMRNAKEIHDVWIECLVEIRDSEDSNVEIVMDEKYWDSPVLQLPRITDDADNFKNRAAAALWGKESVVVRQNNQR